MNINKKQITYVVLAISFFAISIAGYLLWQSKTGIVIPKEEKEQALNIYMPVFEYMREEEYLNDPEAAVEQILLEEKIIFTEAERLGLSASNSEIDTRYREIVDQYESEEQYINAIKQAYSWTPELTKKNIRKEILREKLLPHVLDHRWGRFIHVQYEAGGAPYEEFPKVYEDNAGVWIEEIAAYSRIRGFDAIYDLFHEKASPNLYEREFPSEYSEWNSYTNVVIADEFEYSQDPASEFSEFLSQEQINTVFGLSEGEISSIIRSEEGGYYGVYIVDTIGEGKHDTWEEFIESYKKENLTYSSWIHKLIGLENQAFAQTSSECAGCRGTRVYGRIRDANTGAGISSAFVETYNTGSHSGWCGPGYKSTYSASDGDYVFKRVDGYYCFANCGSGHIWAVKASRSGYYSNTEYYYPSNGGSVKENVWLTPKIQNTLIVRSEVNRERKDGANVVRVSGTTGTSGYTKYEFTHTSDINVTLRAPSEHFGAPFEAWVGCNSTSNRDCTVSITGSDEKTITARYKNCDPEYSLICSGGNVHWQDSCGNTGNMYEACYGDLVCDGGACIDPCAPKHNTYQCVDDDNDGDGDDIYWFDNCGERNDKKEFCGIEREEGAWDPYCKAEPFGDVWEKRSVVVNGCSFSTDACTSNTVEEDKLKEECQYGCMNDACFFPEIDASLTAEPQAGEEPLNSTLTAEIIINEPWGGWADTSSYHLWWDCDNTASNVAETEAECGALPAASPGTCSTNSNGYRCVDVGETESIEVKHSYLAEVVDEDAACDEDKYATALYTTKFIGERGPAPENGVAFEAVKVDPLVVPCELPNPKDSEDITEGEEGGVVAGAVGDIIWVIIMIATPIAATLYIFAGFKLFISAGSVEAVASAKRIFLYTTLGYGVILLGWILTTVIG